MLSDFRIVDFIIKTLTYKFNIHKSPATFNEKILSVFRKSTNKFSKIALCYNIGDTGTLTKLER